MPLLATFDHVTDGAKACPVGKTKDKSKKIKARDQSTQGAKRRSSAQRKGTGAQDKQG